VHTGFWCEELREGHYVEGPGVDGRIILKWIFEKWDGVGTASIRVWIVTDAGLL
jgi:hypothetical protein